MNQNQQCQVCGVETKNKCSNCNQAYYCTVAHQKQNWKTHKPNCRPFKIEKSELLGRYLTATRNIKPFEIVLKEAPLVRGPSQISAPVCLGCLNKIESSDYVDCEKCGWPLCSAECGNRSAHIAECSITAKRGQKVNVQDFDEPHPLYQCVSTLRCLLLQRTDSEKWCKLQELESLENDRRGSIQWKTDLEGIGKFIPKFFKCEDYSEDDIMRHVGILQINGHEVPTSDPPHVAIFHNASLLEHSCSPNLAKSFTRDGNILLWTAKAIKKNEHLSICYSDAAWGTVDRQNHLMHTKLFKCCCARCLDVTEMGTSYSALRCDKKDCDGLLLPTDPKKWTDNWICNQCKRTTDTVSINNILTKAGNDLHAMEVTADNCLKYIKHYQKWLPPQHFYVSEVKIKLVQQIGKDPKDLMAISDDKLNLKMTYSKELIELYETLAPCEVRLLGTLCFELHSAIAEYTRRKSLQTTMSPKSQLEESLMYVDKCVSYLQFEPDVFIEGHILRQAEVNREALRMVLRM